MYLENETKRNELKRIITSDDVIGSIIDNLDILLNIIPELKDMIKFPHNNPHHHLDVWNHTLLAMSLSITDFDIRLCLLLHDIGKPHCYQDKDVRRFKGHPLKSKEITNNILNRLGYDKEYIKYICYLVEMHDEFIKEEDIRNNYELALKRFLIQYCDAFAHSPDKLEFRKRYIKDILDKLTLIYNETHISKIGSK